MLLIPTGNPKGFAPNGSDDRALSTNNGRIRRAGPLNENRQTFVADASRIFEEIERNGGEIHVKADYDFYRAAPSGGYGEGLARSDRTDIGTGAISPEEADEGASHGSWPVEAGDGLCDLLLDLRT